MGSICTLTACSSSSKKARRPRSSSCVVSGGAVTRVLSPTATHRERPGWPGPNHPPSYFLVPILPAATVSFLRGSWAAPAVTTPATSSHSLSPHFASVVTGGTSWEVESCVTQSRPHEPDSGPGGQSPRLPRAGAWLTAVGTRTDGARPLSLMPLHPLPAAIHTPEGIESSHDGRTTVGYSSRWGGGRLGVLAPSYLICHTSCSAVTEQRKGFQFLPEIGERWEEMKIPERCSWSHQPGQQRGPNRRPGSVVPSKAPCPRPPGVACTLSGSPEGVFSLPP